MTALASFDAQGARDQKVREAIRRKVARVDPVIPGRVSFPAGAIAEEVIASGEKVSRATAEKWVRQSAERPFSGVTVKTEQGRKRYSLSR